MSKEIRKPLDGIRALPPFPVVLVTAGRNIMTAAAFSFYSFDPPCVMVGIRPENLTYELISEAGDFGINIPTREQVEQVRVCGSVSGREEDKYTKSALNALKATAIDSLLVAECPVNLECRVVHRVQFGGSHVWFVGEIEAVHVDEGYTRDQALTFWTGEYRAVGKVLQEVRRK
jgi:flavin reductase (DIM6/NTAB) family NADH-FMN oxidoreductase RutF